jgi:hypothetical protein
MFLLKWPSTSKRVIRGRSLVYLRTKLARAAHYWFARWYTCAFGTPMVRSLVHLRVRHSNAVACCISS